MSNHQIVYIDVDNIHPHPQNPRKNLGDLTELAESLKVSGVLQNLTVVPKPDGPDGHYYAVIGNRRHGAAKKAGLKELPCVISTMDEKEQFRTMMVENMNRNDLTVYEEAEGFQMMLDFGDSIDEIAEKTGFSRSTVRHRVKLLELDKDKFQKSAKRGATLQDYIELEKFKDPEIKNNLLAFIGTANFNNELKRAKEHEKEVENRKALLDMIGSFATKVDTTNNLKYIKSYSTYGKLDLEKPEDAGLRAYYYTDSSYYIYLYAEPTKEDQDIEMAQAEKRAKVREREKALDLVSERAFQLRLEFIKGIIGLKKQLPLLTEMTVQSILLEGWSFRFNGGVFLEVIGVEPDENGKFDMEMLTEPIKAKPERVLLAAAYANMGDSPSKSCHKYDGTYQHNDGLALIYDYLIRLGFEMSDEEQAYMDGTHELFLKPNIREDAESEN